jgi:hypothetical protein
MKVSKHLFCSLVSLLLVGMLPAHSAEAQIRFSSPPNQLAGFQIVSTPNTIDSPGVVFSLDPEGVRRELERLDITSEVSIERTPASEKISFKAEMTVADFQRFLRGQESVLAVSNQELTRTTRFMVEISLGGVVRLGLHKKLDEVLEKRSIVKDSNPPKRFFLILESLAASTISYKFKKDDVKKLDSLLSGLATPQSNLRFNPKDSFQLVQRFNTTQIVAVKLNELFTKFHSITGARFGTERSPIETDLAWASVLELLPWPPPAWSARYEIPKQFLKKNGATLGSVFDLISAAYSRAGFSDRWVYGIGNNGFAIIGHQEAIDEQAFPLPGSLRWSESPCPSISLRCVINSAKLDQRITLILVTDWKFNIKSGTDPVVLRQDSGRSSLPEAMRAIPLPPEATGQALIYHFLKKNKEQAELVPQNNEIIQAIDHLVRAGFWKKEDLLQ